MIKYDSLEKVDLDLGTNREWLETLSDEEFAEQVLDVARTVFFDFSKRSNWKCTVKDQEKSFVNWLRSVRFIHKKM